MGSKILIVTLLLLICASIACNGEDGFIYSRATFYGSPECLGSPRGACGYGEYGRTVNNGEVSGVSRLYRNGSGCGACYQVRCTIPTHCSEQGTKLVVTDFGVGDHTDFVLSLRAYSNLARPNMAAELFAYGVVGIEYRQIPCQYASNLVLKVHDRSKFPSYLAVVPLYQGGVYDITAVEVWLEDCKEWRGMRRPFGAVFDMENPPIGALTMRFQVTSYTSGDVKLVQVPTLIPADWKAGVAYDTAVQLN